MVAGSSYDVKVSLPQAETLTAMGRAQTSNMADHTLPVTLTATFLTLFHLIHS